MDRYRLTLRQIDLKTDRWINTQTHTRSYFSVSKFSSHMLASVFICSSELGTRRNGSLRVCASISVCVFVCVWSLEKWHTPDAQLKSLQVQQTGGSITEQRLEQRFSQNTPRVRCFCDLRAKSMSVCVRENSFQFSARFSYILENNRASFSSFGSSMENFCS